MVNIYAPNSNQIKFLQALLGKIRKIQQGRLIIGGDFNNVGGPKIDTSSQMRPIKSHLKAFLHKHKLFDVWRCQHGTERDYSFYSPTTPTRG